MYSKLILTGDERGSNYIVALIPSNGAEPMWVFPYERWFMGRHRLPSIYRSWRSIILLTKLGDTYVTFRLL